MTAQPMPNAFLFFHSPFQRNMGSEVVFKNLGECNVNLELITTMDRNTEYNLIYTLNFRETHFKNVGRKKA